MAEFSKIIPTDNGRALMADVMAGATMEFTKMVLSDTEYSEDELYTLTDIADIKQESELSAITVTGNASVRISAAFTNEGLTEGYTIRSVGLYARQTGGSEILYAAAIETTGTYDMPAQTGTTVSSAYMSWVVTVGNSENVSVEVSSNAYALAVEVNERFDEIELEMENFVLISDARSIVSVTLSA
ncbi:MAG: hypothetical protein LUD72_14685, partial [Bacteroidales bacterium]|nr:hypothetical protein [Bacteroidales bacterium]